MWLGWVSHSFGWLIFFFFFNDTATTEIYTLSLHDALPTSVLHALEEAGVKRPRFGFQHTATHLDTGLGQALHASASHFGVRVLHAGHHPRDAGGHQRIGTG